LRESSLEVNVLELLARYSCGVTPILRHILSKHSFALRVS
jgi:hypothetical protein